MKRLLISLAMVLTLSVMAMAQDVQALSNAGLKIAYVDADSVMSEYVLAQKIQKELADLQAYTEKKGQTIQDKLQKEGNAIQDKYNKGVYKTKTQLDAVQKAFNKKQEKAQADLQQLQQDLQSTLMEKNLYLNSKIDDFIQKYNETKGYDVILKRDATLLINPKYCINREIIDGLNEQYRKDNTIEPATATTPAATEAEAKTAK